jgi:titin
VLIGPSVGGILVQGNVIGLNSAGNTALGNSQSGVEIDGANNTVGSSAAGAHNVIAGNGGDGVLIYSGASGVAVQGNFIGTDQTGKVKLGNSGSGVEVGDNNALIGGPAAAAHNLISGNSYDGVLIDSGVSGTRVQNNYIGTDITGTVALANFNGVEIQGNGTLVGGTTLAVRNTIAGNSNNGVQIDAGATGNGVQGNYIGLSASATALANSGYGVSIVGSNNTVGGTASGAGNTIAFDSLGGVQVSAGNGNSIRRNAIYSNGPSNTGPGIVLSAGANNNLAAPIISTATLNGMILSVTGTFNAPTANVPYVLEFFVSPAGDPEGKIYVGTLKVTPTGTGNQPFTFTTSTTAATATTLITATLTDAGGDTSAFSNGVTS